MTWSLVASTSAVSAGGAASFTTGSITTTGADLIVILAVSGAVGAPPPSDSKSNTWTLITNIAQSGRQGTYLYYAHNPTVGTGHTFTSSNSAFGNIEVMAFSGSGVGTVLDQNSALSTAGNSASHTVPTTAKTPTTNGQLCVCSYGLDDATDTGSPPFSLDQSFTLGPFQGVVSGTSYGGAMGYLAQGSAASVNPTLTRNALNTNGDTYHGLLATFIGSAGIDTPGSTIIRVQRPIWRW